MRRRRAYISEAAKTATQTARERFFSASRQALMRQQTEQFSPGHSCPASAAMKRAEESITNKTATAKRKAATRVFFFILLTTVRFFRSQKRFRPCAFSSFIIYRLFVFVNIALLSVFFPSSAGRVVRFGAVQLLICFRNENGGDEKGQNVRKRHRIQNAVKAEEGGEQKRKPNAENDFTNH